MSNLKPGGEIWTAEEDELIRREYSTAGAVGLQAKMPRRTLWAIRHRANDLGVRRKPGWSERDKRRLIYLWGDGKMHLPAIAAALGRTPVAVHTYAARIGLTVGCPPGYEYLQAAADRCNFDLKTLRRILTWANVTIHPALTAARVNGRQSYVDPDEVDEAVVAWLKTETVRAAALARGVGYKLLYRRLLDAGLVQPKTNNTAWRIPSAEIDRVLSEHASENRSAA